MLKQNTVINTEYIKHNQSKYNKKIDQDKKNASFFFRYRRVEVLCKSTHIARMPLFSSSAVAAAYWVAKEGLRPPHFF